MQLEMMAQDDVKPLFSEINDSQMTQMTSSNSWTASSSSTSAAAAVIWNSDERRRLGAQSDVNKHLGRLGSMRQWPSVTPLDLSVTSRGVMTPPRSVMTPRDDMTVRYSDLQRRLYGDKHDAAR